MSRRLLTVEAVAERLAVTPYTVRQMLRDGHLIGRKLQPGNPKSTWRIPEHALADFENGVMPKTKEAAK